MMEGPMSRPRLDAEQKKVSFSLAFSPNLIAALEKVRGAKSQSVFVEEWLRQHPQIAAELAAMNDPGFAPPVARYEQLMELLLAFYSPGPGEQSTIQSILLIAQKIIIRHHERPGQEIEEQISAEMSAFWLQERRKHGSCTARGESLEDILPAILDYARYYYQVIFQEMAQGERKLLQHRFRSLVRGCEAVYRERLHEASEDKDGDSSTM
jgi:CRISPR type I-D-associated protein Csc3/Cas10d